MSRGIVPWIVCIGLVSSVAGAQETIHFEGAVPGGPNTFFFLEFDVPEGIVEIEVAHAHVPADTSNVLDWGIDDPNGSRGWGASNREDAIVGVDAASRSYIPGSIPAGAWRVTVGKARIVPGEPAGYSVDVTLRTVATLLEPRQRPPYQDPGTLNNAARWYAGDFHVHTRESGDTRATVTIDEALDFAEGQGLDFVMLSEHNTNSGFTLYAGAQVGHPELLIFPGQEFTTYRGHANALRALDNVNYTIGTDGHEVLGGTERQSLSSYVWLRKADDAPDGGVPDAGPDGGSDPGGCSGGCDCRTPGMPSSDGALFSILFLCAWWLLRRRASGRS